MISRPEYIQMPVSQAEWLSLYVKELMDGLLSESECSDSLGDWWDDLEHFRRKEFEDDGYKPPSNVTHRLMEDAPPEAREDETNWANSKQFAQYLMLRCISNILRQAETATVRPTVSMNERS